MTLFKVLHFNGKPFHGGTGQWHLPVGKRPGKWMPAVTVNPCRSGYHLCRPDDLVHWLGPDIYIAEGRGAMIETTNKVVFAQARLLRRCEQWNDRTSRLYAADCAERVLPLYEAVHPNDSRPREAIAMARRFANGDASPDELMAAQWAAEAAELATPIAFSAAAAAARTAWYGAVAKAAETQAWALWATADAAATAAAAAGTTERAEWHSVATEQEWQTQRLHAYLAGAVT